MIPYVFKSGEIQSVILLADLTVSDWRLEYADCKLHELLRENFMLREHHQRTIDKVVAKFAEDKDVIALIFAGSLTKGWGSENSDVDVMIVKTDAAFAQHVDEKHYTDYDPDIADYEGGYVDIKFIDVGFLRDVAQHGSEVARSAFMGAIVPLCHDPEVATLVNQIPLYPEAEYAAKIRSFYTQTFVWNWYVGEAIKRDDKYLLLRAVSDLALFGCRLILTYNRKLFPYHKWLRKQVESAPNKPENMLELMDAMLDKPTRESTQAFFDCINNLHDWGMTPRECFTQFLLDSEWNWRTPQTPLHDW